MYHNSIPAGIYLLKVNNRNTITRCEICSKLIIKTPEQRQCVILVSLLLTLNIFHTLFYVNFEHVIAGWDTQGKDYSVRGRNEFHLNPFLTKLPILHPLKPRVFW